MDSRIIDIIYNEGERLIPFITHDDSEVIRHLSSYKFFSEIMQRDRVYASNSKITVLDIGFGCGYGCFIFSKIPGVTQITGVDVSYACKEFAQEFYGAKNIDFIISDASEYLNQNHEFSYVTSRGVLEHIPNGLSLTQNANYTQRLIIDVPYDEKPGNEHHILVGIKENAFDLYENHEIFYEGLDGTIYDSSNKPADVNMILCVVSRSDLPPVRSMFEFPVQPVTVEFVKQEMLRRLDHQIVQPKNQYFNYREPKDVLMAVEKAIHHVDVVLDIGPGIAPMNYFRPKFHILLEPFDEYVQILNQRFANDGSVFVIKSTSQQFISSLATNSVDSIFLLDVIEHLPKDDGKQILLHAERIARRQIVIFTPLGFMPQSVHEGEKDGWGLGGGSVQEHLSGWLPEDFGEGWDFHICEKFHTCDFRNQLLDRPHGAFFAIKTFFGKPTPSPASIPDVRSLLPSEIALYRLRDEFTIASNHLEESRRQVDMVQVELQNAQVELQNAQVELQNAQVELQNTKNQLIEYQNRFLEKQNHVLTLQSQLHDINNQLKNLLKSPIIKVLRKIRRF